MTCEFKAMDIIRDDIAFLSPSTSRYHYKIFNQSFRLLLVLILSLDVFISTQLKTIIFKISDIVLILILALMKVALSAF